MENGSRESSRPKPVNATHDMTRVEHRSDRIMRGRKGRKAEGERESTATTEAVVTTSISSGGE